MIKLILSILLFSQISFANSYFVQENKNGIGTLQDPFGLIQDAINNVEGGDTIYLREGRYNEKVLISDDFSSPVVIIPYNKEKVIIDGTREISSNWSVTGNKNIFVTTISQDIWQLFKNNEEQIAARWPNSSFINDSVFSQSTWESPDNSATEVNGVVNDVDLLKIKDKNIIGAMAILNTGSFRTYVRKVLTQESDNFTYTPTPNSGYKDKHHHYFLEGSLSLLDTLDEWYYDALGKKLYVYADDISDINNSIFRGKNQSYAFSISNSSNITLLNLKFFATTFHISNSKNITISDCYFAFPNTNKRMLGSEDAPLVSTVDNKKGEPASNIVIKNSIFEHTDGEALVAKATGILLENNIFHHIDWSCGATQGLGLTLNLSSCLNAKIVSNTIYFTGASATLSPGDESIIKNNKVWDTGKLQSDGSVIQCTNTQVYNSEQSYNFIFDTPKYALRYDAPVDDVTVAGKYGSMHNNIVFNTNGMMIKGNNHHIYNNTVFNSTGNGIIILDDEGSNDSSKIFNNLVQKMSGSRSSNLSTTPLPTPFVYTNWNGYEHEDSLVSNLITDYLNDNFTPISEQLIDKGSIIDGLPTNYSGNKPDIGAIESNGDTWVAGANIQFEPYPWDASTALKRSIPVIINSSFIYPNPAVDNINISEENSWVLLTVTGEFIKKGYGDKIDLHDLTPNIYYILIDKKYYSFVKCK